MDHSIIFCSLFSLIVVDFSVTIPGLVELLICCDGFDWKFYEIIHLHEKDWKKNCNGSDGKIFLTLETSFVEEVHIKKTERWNTPPPGDLEALEHFDGPF